MNKKEFKKFGREGGLKKWANSDRRYKLLKLLSAFTDKSLQNKLLRWPTEYLEELLSVYQSRKNQ